MRTLKIIFGNIKKDALHNIVMMAFVGVAIFIMEIALSRFRFQEYTNNLVKDCGMYENYMYVSAESKGVYSKYDNEETDYEHSKSYLARENIAEQLERLKAEGIIEAYYSREQYGAPVTEDVDDRGEFLILPRGLAEDVAFPLSGGKWFDEYKQNDGALPVIIGSDFAGRFHVGDRVKLPILQGDESLRETGYSECVVIGVLERNAMILGGGGSSSEMDTNYLFVSGNDTFIVCADEPMLSTHFGYYVKVAPENQQTVMERIGDLTFTFTFAEMSDRAYENNRLMTEMVTALFVIMMLVCAAGVSSGNLLATISCKKRYAVYFLCGMEWKTGFLVSLIESVIKLVLPAAVGYIAFMRFCVKNQFGEMRVGTINFVVMAAFLLIIFLLTSLKPLSDIKRTSPVGIIVGS